MFFSGAGTAGCAFDPARTLVSPSGMNESNTGGLPLSRHTFFGVLLASPFCSFCVLVAQPRFTCCFGVRAAHDVHDHLVLHRAADRNAREIGFGARANSWKPGIASESASKGTPPTSSGSSPPALQSMRDRRSPRQDAEGRATESFGPRVLLVAWLNRKQGLTERTPSTVLVP